MLGVTERAEAQDGKILPHEVGGIKIASMGTLLSEDKAAIWRGPMVQQALVQLLRDVAWDRLDYLLLDFPPGTGDIPLNLGATCATGDGGAGFHAARSCTVRCTQGGRRCSADFLCRCLALLKI